MIKQIFTDLARDQLCLDHSKFLQSREIAREEFKLRNFCI